MNGLSLSRSGRKKTHHSTTDVMSADTAEDLSLVKKSRSVTFTPGRKNQVVYSTRLTYSQNMLRATRGRAADILNPNSQKNSTNS